MDRQQAAQLLGVEPEADAATVRSAYRRLLLVTHPDVSTAGDATDRTLHLIRAVEVLTGPPPSAAQPSGGEDAPAEGSEAGRTDGAAPPGGATPGSDQEPRPEAPTIEVALVDDDTIGIAAPHHEALMIVLETAHQLGEVAYLDHSAGMVEVVVEFVLAPTSSVVMSLQGRAAGVTEVFCTVEPLSGGEAPSAAAVTRLLLSTMVAMHSAAPT